MPARLNSVLLLHNRIFCRTASQHWHRPGHLGSAGQPHTRISSTFCSNAAFPSSTPLGQLLAPHRSYRSVPLKYRRSSFFKRSFSGAPRNIIRPRYFNSSASSQHYHTHKNPTQSASGTWISVIILGIVSGSIYLFTPATNRTDDADIDIEDLFNPSLEDSTGDSIYWASMTGETLPGRPGTLTPEQEEKLRIFWIAVLHIFGVLDKEHAKHLNSTANGVVPPSLSRQGTSTSEKSKKKKKHGWFGLRSKDSDASDAKPATIADVEDKYGQTAQFKHALANMPPELLRKAFWSMTKHDHPDALLLRFLRARKWDIEKALVMMVSTMHWRAVEMHVDDDILVNGEEAMLLDSKSDDPAKNQWGKDFLAQIDMGKSFLHGTDKNGRPICFVRARQHHAGDQSEASLERYTVYMIELARFLLQPPCDTATVLFDMTDFSLANMDYAPVKFMIKVFEANYPESLGIVLIHKSPWIFQGIWKIIRNLLDPVVANKVHFTNKVDEMEEFIEKSHIPKDLGGEEDWDYKYIPAVIGENEKMKDVTTKAQVEAERQKIVEDFEKATISWIENSSDEETKKKRWELRVSLKENYWKLDPYIRSRSYYDRIGMVKPGGHLQFYPSSKKEALVSEAALAPTAAPAAAPNGNADETSPDDVD